MTPLQEPPEAITSRSAGLSRIRPDLPAFDIVAMAASLGGLEALSQTLAALPPNFAAPVVVVQHLSARFPSHLVEILSKRTALTVVWARPGHLLRRGVIYVAPPDRHLLISPYHSIRLGQGPPIHFVRPSADALFASVAEAYRERAIAVVLTGSRADGASGARAIKRQGGRVLAQDAATSRAFGMPGAAIATGCVDFVLPLAKIAPALVALTMAPGAAALLRTRRPVAPDAQPLRPALRPIGWR
jgi:two-component system, chemotaxis family, protein-glutamate methylesterase/glutaminase